MRDEFSDAVIGKAIQVHRELGPGLDQVFYHELLSKRLREAGIKHESCPSGQLMHRGVMADAFEADLLFPERLVVELKCLRGAFEPEHYVQLVCYLKFWRVATGLIFDFAKESLDYRRVNYTPPPSPRLAPDDLLKSAPDFASDQALARTLCERITRIAQEHGFGYRDTTYRGLLTADLAAAEIECVAFPAAPVRCDDEVLGGTRCDCLTVANRFGVLVLALRKSIATADRAILQTYLRLLNLPWGLILNFAKTSLEHQWVSPRRTAEQFQAPSPPESSIQSVSVPNLWEP